MEEMMVVGLNWGDVEGRAQRGLVGRGMGSIVEVALTSFSLRGTPHLCARHLALFVTNFDRALFVAVICFTLSV